jgi:hypothetical protein
MKLFVLDQANFGAYHEDGTCAVLAETKEQAVDLMVGQAIEDKDDNPWYKGHEPKPFQIRMLAYYAHRGYTSEQLRANLLDMDWREVELTTPQVVCFNYGCDC